jgi:hypothetical protein
LSFGREKLCGRRILSVNTEIIRRRPKHYLVKSRESGRDFLFSAKNENDNQSDEVLKGMRKRAFVLPTPNGTGISPLSEEQPQSTGLHRRKATAAGTLPTMNGSPRDPKTRWEAILALATGLVLEGYAALGPLLAARRITDTPPTGAEHSYLPSIARMNELWHASCWLTVSLLIIFVAAWLGLRVGTARGWFKGALLGAIAMWLLLVLTHSPAILRAFVAGITGR